MGGRFSLELLRTSQIGAYLVARKDAAGPKAANRDLVELRAIMNWAIRKCLYHVGQLAGSVRGGFDGCLEAHGYGKDSSLQRVAAG